MHPITNKLAFHDGIDIAGELNQDIYALMNGYVSKVYFSNSYGNVIEYEAEIDNRILTFFMAHLEEVSVTEGQYIKKGDIIGKVGSTGQSTGPHLHFSLFLDGVLVNPLYVLE